MQVQLKLFHYFAFGSAHDKWFVNIDRSQQPDEDDSSYAKRIRMFLLGMFKSSPHKLVREVSIYFENENGVGAGLVDTYVGLIQKYLIYPMFEGNAWLLLRACVTSLTVAAAT